MSNQEKTSQPEDTRVAAQQPSERHVTARHAGKTLFRSFWMSILAAVTWAAAGFHTASSTCIVAASYFTAWVTRQEHRLLLFFAQYGGQVLEEDAKKDVPTEAQIDAQQEQSSRGESGWDKDERVTNLFGGKPPTGQA